MSTLLTHEASDGDSQDVSKVTYESFVDAVVNRAVIYKMLTLDWDNLETRGLDPRADYLFGSKIGLFDDPRSKLSALKRRRRFDIEQWGSWKGQEALLLAHHRETAKFYVEHYKDEVNEEAASLTDQIYK